MSTTVPSMDLPNGRKMPILGLGTFGAWNEEAVQTINTALECGYRHFDTAAGYQNEEAVGKGLQPWLESGKLQREDLFITTKLPANGNQATAVGRFLDASLKKLNLTYVDLYLFHNPAGFKGKDDDDQLPIDEDGNIILDYETDLEAVYGAMEEQVDQGKAKSIGLSNFNSEQIERIMKVCRIQPANLQVEVHAYHQQKNLRAICDKYGISVCAFAPFGAPYVYKSCDNSPMLLENPTVKSIAERLDKTPGQILLRFLIQLGIIVIPKSSNPERLKQNFEVFDFELSSSDMSSLDALDKGERGKLFRFTDVFKGIDRHPEYSFRIPF